MAHRLCNVLSRPPVHPEGGRRERLAMLLCQNARKKSFRVRHERHGNKTNGMYRFKRRLATKSSHKEIRKTIEVLPPWFAPTSKAKWLLRNGQEYGDGTNEELDSTRQS